MSTVYAFNRALLYVEGGAAWERVDYSASTTMIGTAYRANDNRSGWAIGGGGEYAFSDRLSPSSNTAIMISARSESR